MRGKMEATSQSTRPRFNQKVTLTSPYTVSSLAFAEGDLFTTGKLIATSWFHGGIREIGAL
jgi:hypothetical protein